MLSITQVRSDLQADLARLVLKHDIPGVSVAVAVGDETAEFAAGVLNRRTGAAVRPDSVFQIQSITKVWTATLVMQLVDEGLVDLDDPVRTHLPQFRTADPEASATITIRHLLTHTGGFEGDIWKSTTAGDDALRRLVEDLVSQAPQHLDPGKHYSYCSAGMAVLGRLIEVERGMPFASALRRHLAEPLGIEEIAFNAEEALSFDAAIGHAAYGDRGLRPTPRWATMPESNPAAGNQLAMSARALLDFARMHLSDGLGPGGKRVLSEAAAKQMRTGQVAFPASPHRPNEVGLAWALNHEGAVALHGGDTLGIAAILVLVPEHRTAVAVLTNGGDFMGLLRELIHPWIDQAANLEPDPDRPLPDRTEPVGDLEAYAGVYGTHNQRLEVSVTDDGRLESTFSMRGDGAAMIERQGVSVEPSTSELRRVEGEVFASVSADGTVNGHSEFLDLDGDGRPGFIHTGGRTMPRLGA